MGEGSLSVGGTAYLYTGEFDETYLEVNLGAGYGPLSVEFSIGQYDSPPEGGAAGDKSGLLVHRRHGGARGILWHGRGLRRWTSDGNYGEVGYGFSAADLDFTISGILNDSSACWPELDRPWRPDAQPHPGLRHKQDVRTQLTDIPAPALFRSEDTCPAPRSPLSPVPGTSDPLVR